MNPTEGSVGSELPLPNPPGYLEEHSRDIKTFDDLLDLHRDVIASNKRLRFPFDHTDLIHVIELAKKCGISLPEEHPYVRKERDEEGKVRYVYLGEGNL